MSTMMARVGIERRSLGIGSHSPFESWGRFLPEHATAVSLLDRLSPTRLARRRFSCRDDQPTCWMARKERVYRTNGVSGGFH